MLKIEKVAGHNVLIEPEISFLKIFKKGKVRSVYEIGEYLLIIATDRISAFDKVMLTAIPEKGRYLTMQSGFWFKMLEERGFKTHFITDSLEEIVEITGEKRLLELEWLEGRVMLGKKAEALPVEAICRFRVFGSAVPALKNDTWIWDPIEIEGELKAGAMIKNGPAFTPTDKSETDEKITFSEMAEMIGQETSEELREKTVDIFRICNNYAKDEFNMEIADGKVEWGRKDGELILIDETFTSDSARFMPDKSKELFRTWLTENGLKGKEVEIPEKIALEISELYKSQCHTMNLI